MLYESYKNKLEKRRRRFERLWRFRLLFLLAILMALAAVAALMGVKGQVTKVSVPERFAYGEPLSMQASTVFGGAGFEFRLQGTEQWSEKAPRAAGVYECRAVGKSIVGTKRPGDTYLFTIDPVETVVRVADSTLVYGEEPTFSAELCYDDVLHVTSYTVEERGGGYNIVADPDAVSVLSAEGEDVTASYTIDVADRDVREIARPLTVRTASHTFEYDGKPHADETLTLEGYGLAEGHTVEAEFLSLTDAGEIVNRPAAFRILDENGDDVTDKYVIDEDFGTLEVQRRKITVSTRGEVIPYDGGAHEFDDIEAVGLASGQKIERTDIFSVQNAGEYTNRPQYDIFDGENRTTDNYEIAEEFGAIEVTRRPLTVSTKSETLPYDGGAHPYDDIAAAGLADGQTIERADIFTVQNAGEYANRPQYDIFDGARRTTDNYEITENFGTVTVTKIAVTVETSSAEFVYDGREHRYGVEEEAYELTGALATGQELKFFNVLVMQDAGERPNEPEIKVFDGDDDVTANYDITKVYGTVRILRRVVEVETHSHAFPYDGQVHTELGFTVLPAQEGRYLPVEGHELISSAVASVLNYSDTPTPNELAFTVTGGASAAADDLTDNYLIRIVHYGELTVEKRVVTLRAGSYTGEYDGKEHTAEEWSEESGSLADGHRAAGTYMAFADVQTSVNDPEEKRILDRDGHDVTGNYTVTWETGKIEILPREVTLRAGSYAGVYDGEAHSAEEWSEESGSLADGHRAAGVFRAFTDAGTHDNDPTQKRILDLGGRDVTHNYNVKWVKGSIDITKREVTLLTGSDEVTYDAKEHKAATFTAQSLLGIVGGHEVAADFKRWTEANEEGYENSFDEAAVRILDAGGEDVTANYTISWQWGTVVILKRHMTVTADSDSRVYDGQAHSINTYKAEACNGDRGLAEGHIYTATATPAKSFTNVRDTGEIKLEYSEEFIGTEGGENCIANYEIEYFNGTVEITKRPATVTTKDHNFVYDGKEHSFNDVEAENLADGQSVKRTDELFVKTVKEGGYENRPAVQIFAGSEETTDNYAITYVCGTVTVEKRPIHITTATDSFVYNGAAHTYGVETVRVTDPEEDENAGLAQEQTLGIVDGSDSVYTFLEARKEAYTNRPSVHVFDEAGDDVWTNYDIIYDYGTVTIDFRPLHVTTGTQVFLYDDKPHDHRDYTITDNEADAGLAPDHTFTVISGTTLTDVDEKENILTYHITDKNSDEVTKNYIIEETHGKISVTARHVKFRSGSITGVEYDADPHGAPTYEDLGREEGPVYRLVEGHELVAEYPTRTVVGSEDNRPDHVKIMRNGAEVTSNYVIETWELGTIEILQRKVSLETDSESFVYDALEHSVKRYTEKENTLVAAHGHRLSAVYPSRVTVGETVNEATQVRIFEGEADVTENYDISWAWGKVVVTVRPVTITSDGGEHVYDDTDFSVPTYTVEEFNEEGHSGLVTGHIFTADVTAPVLHDVETRSNELQYKNIKVMAGGEEVTGNYQFIEGHRPVAVLVRPVTITTGSGTFVYDGEMHSVRTYTVEAFDKEAQRGLVGGHIFSADEVETSPVVSTVTQGTVINIFNLTNIKVMAGEKPVTANYKFVDNYTYGTLRITPRPVTVTVGGGEKVYNGKPQKCENFETDRASDYSEETENRERGLLEGHIVRPSFPAYLDAGTYLNELIGAPSIVGALGREVSDNYTVTVGYTDDHRFAILRRPITVSDLVGGTFVYDGLPHASNNFTCEEEGENRGLLSSLGHTFVGADGVEVTNVTDVFDEALGIYTAVGTVLNGIKNQIQETSQDTWYVVDIRDASGANVWQNYKVELGEMAPLRVKPRIAVRLYSYSKQYDGTPLFYDPEKENFFIEALPPDVEEAWVKVTLGGSVTEIGALTLRQIQALSVCSVMNGDTDLTAENGFEFRGPELPLTVTQRALRIHVTDFTAERTGKPYTYEGDESSYWFTFGGLLDGHTLTCKVSGVLQVGDDSAPITLTDVKIVDGEGKDVTDVYDWSVTEGTLSWAEDETETDETEQGETEQAEADTKRRSTE